MALLGRAALIVSLGLVVYALVAGSYAAWKRRRRLALAAQNALIAAFGSTRRAGVAGLCGGVRQRMNWQSRQVKSAAHVSYMLHIGLWNRAAPSTR